METSSAGTTTANIKTSTPSPVSGKKAWLLQRAQQTHDKLNDESGNSQAEPQTPRNNGVPLKAATPPSKKKKVSEAEKQEVKPEEQQPHEDISHEDAAMLLTQMAADVNRLETQLRIPPMAPFCSTQRPLISPSGG
ncbi:hypothetical protein Tcan_00326, partial [Toxocara canis]